LSESKKRGEDDGSMYKCFDCKGREFASLGEFERHIVEVHSDNRENAISHSKDRISRNASDVVR
jgi:hypothetical protein